MSEKYGYYKTSDLPPSNGHPEMADYKPGDRLLVASFDDYDVHRLQERVMRSKMEALFDEPSSYEDEDDGSDFTSCLR